MIDDLTVDTLVKERRSKISAIHSDAEVSPLPELSSKLLSVDAFQHFKLSIRKDKVVCIGAGYVGGPTMAVMAKKCPDLKVYVVDISKEKIDQWNSDVLPIYEPGLNEIVKQCDIIFVSVNTPTKRFGIGKGMAADMSAWESASRFIAAHSKRCKIVVEKSTVPVRTADNLKRILNVSSQHGKITYSIVSNPEFLAEGLLMRDQIAISAGTAIRDLEFPDRVLIGGREDSPIGRYAMNCLVDIYSRWVPPDRILTTNVWSSELSKLVANSFLAQRVSSINAVAMLCERVGADVRQGMPHHWENNPYQKIVAVAKTVGADTRIGPQYLNASVGFGGSCLEKDVLNLAYLCEFYGLREAAQYWQMVKDMNDLQKHRFALRIIHGLFNTVNQKKIAIFGFSFKKNTADTRNTPAVDVCTVLMKDGARLHVYDPKVSEKEALQEFHNSNASRQINLKQHFFMEALPEEAVRNAHAIVILTEWNEFLHYDYSKFYSLMTKPAFVFDGRNLLSHGPLIEIGFEVHGVGVPSGHPSFERVG